MAPRRMIRRKTYRDGERDGQSRRGAGMALPCSLPMPVGSRSCSPECHPPVLDSSVMDPRQARASTVDRCLRLQHAPSNEVIAVCSNVPEFVALRLGLLPSGMRYTSCFFLGLSERSSSPMQALDQLLQLPRGSRQSGLRYTDANVLSSSPSSYCS